MRFQNLSDLDIEFFKVTEVKCDSIIGFAIYAFLLMFNSNIWPNSARLRDIRFQNKNGLDIDVSRSLGSNVITSMDSPYMRSY